MSAASFEPASSCRVSVSGGPMMLSWRDVAEGGGTSAWGYNVVIHEFVHVIDMRDGQVDGMPALPTRVQRERWQAVMGEAFARHAAEVDADRPTWLDPYAAQGPEEFFPVAAEAFFVAPHGLALEFPEVYALMRDFFHQDPRLHAR